MTSADQKRKRSTIPKAEARRRYIEAAELVVLDQIRKDSRLLDERAIAVGPFARLDANAVAAHEGKTRGAINNLFGSQAVFQAETMALALSARDWIDQIEYPDPAGFAEADAWVDAFFAAQSARGPLHGADPAATYAFLWALWLSAVPYGLWSEEIGRSSMDEHVQWLTQLEQVIERALDRFGLRVRAGTTVNDLACAIASLTEGVWLNQCLTTRHPSDASRADRHRPGPLGKAVVARRHGATGDALGGQFPAGRSRQRALQDCQRFPRWRSNFTSASSRSASRSPRCTCRKSPLPAPGSQASPANSPRLMSHGLSSPP